VKLNECDCRLVAVFGERCNLVREDKMFVKDKAKISSRVGGVELRVVLCILATWFLSLEVATALLLSP